MMKAHVLVASLLVALVSQAHAEEAKRATALNANVVLKVIHVDEVRQKVLAEVEKAGGFHVLVTDAELRLKVPPQKLSETLTAINQHGLVLQKTINREDLTQDIAQLEGLLRSKEDIFARLEKLINDSDLSSTLNIERTMGVLVGEIESTKGRLRVQKERAAWAVITLSFRFHQREQVVYVHSPFDWLNSVDLPRFVEEF